MRQIEIKTRIITLLFLGVIVGFTSFLSYSLLSSLGRGEDLSKSTFLRIPLHFEKAAGSTDFMARGHSYDISITATGARLALRSEQRINRVVPEAVPTVQMVNVQLNGSNKNARPSAGKELPAKSNHFIGNDPSRWRTNVANYERVKYDEVYEGIDVEYYGNQGQIEYDFSVKPFANPNQIEIQFTGVRGIAVSQQGDLAIATNGGDLVQKQPFIYQLEENGTRHLVDGGYVVNDTTVSFWLGDYDRSMTLVIDPIFIYSTYHGGPGDDVAGDLAVGNDGSVYVVGSTSGGFPLTDPIFPNHSGSSDVFVSKLNHLGTGFDYTTYLGGGSFDVGSGIEVDQFGNVYVAGTTRSSNFPTTNPRQPDLNGASDGFVAKLSPNGDSLVFSTFHGGNAFDAIRGIALDADANIYLTGESESDAQFPLMHARQGTNAGGTDAFISALSTNGSQLRFSTFHGGAFYDIATAIDVSSTGEVFITGETQSQNFGASIPYFPITTNARQSNNRGQDAFFSRLKLNVDAVKNTTELSLVYSTYFGGNSSDRGEAIVFDGGLCFITGSTSSTSDFPLARAKQANYGGGVSDAFVTTFNGPAIYQSTYLGGSGRDMGRKVEVRSDGSVRKLYVGGVTESVGFPTVTGDLVPKGSVDFDVFLSIYDMPSFSTPQQGLIDRIISTERFGGTESEELSGLGFDGSGNVFFSGFTSSTNFPTANALQRFRSSENDVFVSYISAPVAQQRFYVSGRVMDQNGVGISGIVVTASGDDLARVATDSNGNYSIELPAGGSYTVTADVPSHTTVPPAGYTFDPLTGNQTERHFVFGTPTNDNLANAIEITGASGTIVANQFGATREVGEPMAGQRSIWYKWRSPVTGRLKFFVTPDFSPISVDNIWIGSLSIYMGTNYENFKIPPVSFNSVDKSINIDVVENQEYRIAILKQSTFDSTRNLSLGWGNYVTISGSVLPQSTNSISEIPMVSIVARSLDGDPQIVESPQFREFSITQSIRYFVRVPRGRSYLLVPEGPFLSISPKDSTLSNVVDDTGSVLFTARWSRTLSSNAIVNTTVLPSDSVVAPFVHFVHPSRSGGTSVSTSGGPYLYPIEPPFPLDIPGQATAYHPNFSFNTIEVVAGSGTISLQKMPSICGYGFSPGPPSSIAAAGGLVLLQITASPGTCALNVTSVFSWLSASVAGNTVTVTAQPNRTGKTRKGILLFGEQRFPVYIDQPPAPFLTVGNATLIEGNSGDSVISVPIRRSGMFIQASVDWSTANGTAVAGEDFNPVSGSVTFQPNESEKTIQIQVKGDLRYERNEDIKVVLSNPAATTLPIIENIGSAIVVNDDPGLSFFDYDGDGKSDPSVFRASNGTWYVSRSGLGDMYVMPWGLAGDNIVPADYDGDGKTDLAVRRPADNNFYVFNSSNSTMEVRNFGIAGDIALPSDYNGDGKADVAVWRPSNGTWYLSLSGSGIFYVMPWGLAADKPVPGDYDGDGKTDLAVFRPTEGRWYMFNTVTGAFSTNDFGMNGDTPVQADYSGDGKTDFAVYRASNNTWYRQHTNDGTFNVSQWGLAGDFPTPGDFDGDGRTDVAVWRPSDGTWYVLKSTSGVFTQSFGTSGDTPTPNAFVY